MLLPGLTSTSIDWVPVAAELLALICLSPIEAVCFDAKKPCASFPTLLTERWPVRDSPRFQSGSRFP
jgi:hypothetical protein